jgi:hypothetical protein
MGPIQTKTAHIQKAKKTRQVLTDRFVMPYEAIPFSDFESAT